MKVSDAKFMVWCRPFGGEASWYFLSAHELREAAMSAADVYASAHTDQETAVFELTTIMHTELVTRVVKV